MSFKLTVLVVGGGAAGLMAAITAARENPAAKVIIVDSAKKLGAKILVSGGARCNVTHYKVDAGDYAGGSRNSIKKILLRYDVLKVVAFFGQLGVQLKQEQSGKLFPATDSAKDVLNALLKEAGRLGVQIRCLSRVNQIERYESEFTVKGDWGSIRADKLILSTGGKSLPKSGSDGFGYLLAKSLGHSLTEQIMPALVPLLLPKDNILCSLSGLTLPVVLKLVSGSNKKIVEFHGSMLLTHFGLSGPVVLDISRYWTASKLEGLVPKLSVNFVPEYQQSEFEYMILQSGGRKSVKNFLSLYLPNSLADALCVVSRIKQDLCCDQLSKPQRKILLSNTMNMALPVVGDRGFTYAEVTAGGIPLPQINANTMESRICKGLYLCGEICDVDGRIGGFNFQWAWASGYIAGLSAVSVKC